MHKVYKKNFLSKVIFRIDYDPIYKISEPPVEFQEKIKSIFPLTENKEIDEIQLDVKTKEHKQNKMPLWVFRSKDKQSNVSLNCKFCYVEFDKYKSFTEFTDIIELVYNTFIDIYKPFLIVRLGLRYVNNISFKSGNAFDWKGYLKPSLIHYINDMDIEDKENLSRAISQFCFSYDDYKINFLRGLFNREFPNRISRREYLLDYDCYGENLKPDTIMNCIRNYNDKIVDLFEKSIDGKLRKEMIQ